jgi:hypothetical protein
VRVIREPKNCISNFTALLIYVSCFYDLPLSVKQSANARKKSNGVDENQNAGEISFHFMLVSAIFAMLDLRRHVVKDAAATDAILLWDGIRELA